MLVPKDCMTRGKEIVEFVNTDVLGKKYTEAIDGHCYAIEFVDSFSRFSKVNFIKTRDEVLDKFKQFCADVGKTRTLVSDGGGEYVSKEFKRYCRNQGNRFENSAPYTLPEKGKNYRILGNFCCYGSLFLRQRLLGQKILDVCFDNGFLRQKHAFAFSS